MGCTTSKELDGSHESSNGHMQPGPRRVQGKSLEESAPGKFDIAGYNNYDDGKIDPYESESDRENDPVGEAAREKFLNKMNSTLDKEITRVDNIPAHRALFLGTGESGKSTVFKQMRLCYGSSFQSFEREQYSKLIWADVLRSMRILVDICEEELNSSEGGDPELKMLVENWLYGRVLERMLAANPHPSEATTIPTLRMVNQPISVALAQTMANIDLVGGLDRMEPGPPSLDSLAIQAIRKSVEVMQALDLSRRAFLDEQEDKIARTFLQNHVTNSDEVTRKLNSTGPMGCPPDDDLLRMYNHIKASREPHPVLTQAVAGYAAVGDLMDVSLEAKLSMKDEVERPGRLLIAAAVHILWQSCPARIKDMVMANQLGLETNTAFFLNRVGTMATENFLASNDDILHARIKTTGIQSTEFEVHGEKLIVTDVGGQRIERKKWIHNFDDVTCVLYVVSVSEYDQGLEEDDSVNRLEEALDVFDRTVNSQWFRAKSIQLFLNKVDILKHKCRFSSFKDNFPGYTGGRTDDEAIMVFIEQMFRKRFKQGSRNLYVHRTCATDTTTMKFVVNAVSDMVLYENLKWSGMI